MFLLGLAVSGKILADKHIYENIYTVYERLCGKHKTLEEIRQWNYYDAVQFEYDDDAEADRNIILTRDIKSQMKRIQKSINHYLQENGMAEITIPRQNCSKQLDDCTKYVLYYALKHLVKDELYNLYPEKNRSKPHKLITLLNIFFHNNGDYSFSEAPTVQETQSVYDKKAFLKEYSFPQNGYMVKLIEKNNRNNKSVYVVGKDVLLEHSEYFKDIFESENIFYFVVTRYTKTFSKQFYELQENEKGNFNGWVEDILNESEKITTDFDMVNKNIKNIL